MNSEAKRLKNKLNVFLQEQNQSKNLKCCKNKLKESYL